MTVRIGPGPRPAGPSRPGTGLDGHSRPRRDPAAPHSRPVDASPGLEPEIARALYPASALLRTSRHGAPFGPTSGLRRRRADRAVRRPLTGAGRGRRPHRGAARQANCASGKKRLAAGIVLVTELGRELAKVEADPGSSRFAGGKHEKRRNRTPAATQRL